MPINPKKTSPLRPLPMRITEMQWERLNAARDYDDIAIQEHVRRALDKYLDALDTRRSRVAPANEQLPDFVKTRSMPTIEEANASLARATGADTSGRRRVVYR